VLRVLGPRQKHHSREPYEYHCEHVNLFHLASRPNLDSYKYMPVNPFPQIIPQSYMSSAEELIAIAFKKSP
jgi:hypothetical protein